MWVKFLTTSKETVVVFLWLLVTVLFLTRRLVSTSQCLSTASSIDLLLHYRL